VDQNRVLIGLTAVAMALPSAYTLKWSIPEKGETKFLAFMSAACGLTLFGAFEQRDEIMMVGFALICLGYAWVVVDAYRKKKEQEET